MSGLVNSAGLPGYTSLCLCGSISQSRNHRLLLPCTLQMSSQSLHHNLVCTNLYFCQRESFYEYLLCADSWVSGQCVLWKCTIMPCTNQQNALLCTAAHGCHLTYPDIEISYLTESKTSIRPGIISQRQGLLNFLNHKTVISYPAKSTLLKVKCRLVLMVISPRPGLLDPLNQSALISYLAELFTESEMSTCPDNYLATSKTVDLFNQGSWLYSEILPRHVDFALSKLSTCPDNDLTETRTSRL